MITKVQAATSNYIIRDGYGDFPDNTGNWTILVRFKYPAAPVANYINILSLFDGAADFTDPYLFLGSEPNTGNCIIEIFDGSTDTISVGVSIVNNAQNWAAITNNATTHVQTLIVNGVTIGTLNFNLSTIIWDKLTLLGDAGGGPEAVSVAYCFAWSSIKTLVQLTAQAASIVPLTTSDLIWNTPLQTSVDLTAHNNTLNQLVAIGTVTTDLTDPLLSVVSGPPTNIDPNTATLITYDSAVFQNTLTAGAATTVWHKSVAQTGDKVLGGCSFGDLVTYLPTFTVYDGLANALANSPILHTSSNKPAQFQVTAGNTYYYKSLRNGAVTPATLQLSILRGLTLPVSIGSLAVPDVTDGFPLAFLDPETAYPINWRNDFPAGEEVGIISNGKVLTENADDDNVNLWDTQLNLLAVPTAVASRFQIAGSNETQFAAAKGFGGVDEFVLIDEFGNVGAVTYSIGAGGFRSISLSPDASIAYIIQSISVANTPVKKFVLATTTLSTFVAGEANHNLAPNVLCLPDGTVLAGYNRVAVTHHVVHYNADGTTAHTFALDADDDIERLALDVSGSTHFWVWTQPDGFISKFRKIKISDGSIPILSTGYKYNDGLYQAAANNTPVRFGHSFSCPLWIVKVAMFPIAADASGLYILTGTGNVAAGDNPSLTHDNLWVDSVAGTTENVAIPNPFGEGFLVGDE